MKWPAWTTWFNWSSPMWLLPCREPWVRLPFRTVRLWNLFNRRSTEGHWWGVGLLQLGQQHLFLACDHGVCVLFVWARGGPQ